MAKVRELDDKGKENIFLRGRSDALSQERDSLTVLSQVSFVSALHL